MIYYGKKQTNKISKKKGTGRSPEEIRHKLSKVLFIVESHGRSSCGNTWNVYFYVSMRDLTSRFHRPGHTDPVPSMHLKLWTPRTKAGL